MDYKTRDKWFYACDMGDPAEVQTVRTIFQSIRLEAQNAARNPHPYGVRAAAESLGYKSGHLSFELFVSIYLDELIRIAGFYVRKSSGNDFQSWIDRLLEEHLGE